MNLNDALLHLGKPKRRAPKYSARERKEIIAEMKKPIRLETKVTNYLFENWIETQVKRAENRYLEAKRKNLDEWILRDTWRKASEIKQAEINFLAIIY